MCFFKSKWQKFNPTAEYLEVVKDITSISKLHMFIRGFTYKSDKGDYWKTPEETLNSKVFDCEDVSIFCQDVLVRIQKREAVVIIYLGVKKEECHAVCAFHYGNKLSFFSNKKLFNRFDNYEDIGHHFYSKLKQMLVFNNDGKIIKKRVRLFGTF